MRLIDYDALMEALNEEYKKTVQLILEGEKELDSLAEGFTEACNVAWKMAQVNVTEVVRCKDCKYLMFSDMYGECEKRLRIVRPDDFCSEGEKC